MHIRSKILLSRKEIFSEILQLVVVEEERCILNPALMCIVDKATDYSVKKPFLLQSLQQKQGAGARIIQIIYLPIGCFNH